MQIFVLQVGSLFWCIFCYLEEDLYFSFCTEIYSPHYWAPRALWPSVDCRSKAPAFHANIPVSYQTGKFYTFDLLQFICLPHVYITPINIRQNSTFFTKANCSYMFWLVFSRILQSSGFLHIVITQKTEEFR